MVSTYPNGQLYNFTHMYSFVDLRGKKTPELCVNSGSLYDFINKNKNLSKFRTIIERAQMMGQLNDSQADFTIMIPKDEFLAHIPVEYFEKMDDGLAKQILNCSTMRRKIDKWILTSSPVAYYTTRNPEMRMYVTNISGQTRVNNCATVVQYDIPCTNGLVHFVDNILAPNLDHFMN